MKVDINRGLLEGARFVPSPNYDARPVGMPIEVLVIHAISLPPGQFEGDAVEQLFCNTLDCSRHPYYKEIDGLKVSAHLFIRRDGSIIQFVPLHARAWHAGESTWSGRSRVNDFSIGIELEGADDSPFENPQYQTLANVSQAIMRAYPSIAPANIVGHQDISPGRKTDPGPHFDWARYRSLL